MIDSWAIDNADKLWNPPDKSGTKLSWDLLKQISAIYAGAKVENSIEPSENFSAAYHTPITGDLEFLIARTLYYYGNPVEGVNANENLGWAVHLRRQQKKKGMMLAPDIRIERQGRTIGIIEIKARVGWMQAFFSKARLEEDIAQGKGNSRELIGKAQAQLEKYIDGYDFGHLKTERMFMLIPSLEAAHRKKRTRETFKVFKRTFVEHSGLKEKNLVVLTKDLNYDAGMLSKSSGKAQLANPDEVTGDFEKMVSLISKN